MTIFKHSITTKCAFERTEYVALDKIQKPLKEEIYERAEQMIILSTIQIKRHPISVTVFMRLQTD